jgi:hypothetical protein
MPIATNPYNVGIATNPKLDFDASSQLSKYKDEEATHIAPQVLPFVFDGTHEFIGNLYKSLLDLRSLIINAEKNPQVNNKYTHPILGVIDDIGNKVLMDIPEMLDKLQLSHTIEHD